MRSIFTARQIGFMVLSLLMVLFLIIGCTDVKTVYMEKSTQSKGSTVISINRVQKRTVLPALDMTPVYYQVSGTGPDNQRFDLTTDQDVLEITDLVIGVWTIQIEAFNGDTPPVPIGNGSNSIIIQTGYVTACDVVITPAEGTGTLDLILTWSETTIANPSVEAYLTRNGGIPLPVSLNLQDNQAVHSSLLETGYYILNVKLYDTVNDTTFYTGGATEIIRIVSDQTTDADVDIVINPDISPEDGLVSIIPQLADPITVILNGQQDFFLQGESVELTVSAPAETEPLDFNWYLNDIKKAVGTAFMLDETIPAGDYRLDVTALTHDLKRAGSTTYYFTISALPPVLARWRLDGDFTDEMGNNDAVAQSHDGVVYTDGRDGLCPAFDGSVYGSVAEPVGLDRDVYTITAWVRRTDFATGPYIRMNGNFHIVTGYNGNWRLIGEGGMSSCNSGYYLPLHEWHFFAVTIDNVNREMTYHVDGKRIDNGGNPDPLYVHSYTSSWSGGASTVYIGNYSASYRWIGNIDDLVVYAGKLTNEQIESLYNAYPDEPAGAPDAPSGLTTVAAGFDRINLSWLDGANNEAGFIIERAADNEGAPGEFSVVATIGAGITEYSDSGLMSAAIYHYRVKAFNPDGESGYSNTAMGETTNAGILPAILAHWKFEGNLLDETGNNNAVNGGDALLYTTGMDGQCPVFDGAGYALVDDPAGLDGEIFTIAAWVRKTNAHTSPYIRFTNNFHIITSSSGDWSIAGEGGYPSVYSGYTLPLDEWHHVTVVIDATYREAIFYIDGVRINRSGQPDPGYVHHVNGQWQSDVGRVYLGYYGGAYIWQGGIDDVIVYGGKLSNDQVLNLYNSYTTGN